MSDIFAEPCIKVFRRKDDKVDMRVIDHNLRISFIPLGFIPAFANCRFQNWDKANRTEIYVLNINLSIATTKTVISSSCKGLKPIDLPFIFKSKKTFARVELVSSGGFLKDASYHIPF